MRRTFLTSALDMPEIMSYIYSKSWKLQFSASSSIIIIEDYYLQTFLHSLVLSRDEINAIIDATPNLKHKAIIATMYSSGLRVSEVVHLHYDDISRTNMTIHVRETKGRIDRYTILSQKNLDLLTEYWYKCGRPKDILFPSSWSGGYLDIASVNQFFKKSAKLAGINRHVSSHACRHSFASHLFESGTDIKYIQSLLGHVDPRSTDVYLHVSNKTLLGIRSPFDNPEGGES